MGEASPQRASAMLGGWPPPDLSTPQARKCLACARHTAFWKWRGYSTWLTEGEPRGLLSVLPYMKCPAEPLVRETSQLLALSSRSFTTVLHGGSYLSPALTELTREIPLPTC